MYTYQKPSGELYAVSILRGLAALGVVFFHSRVDLWAGWKLLRSGTIEATEFDYLISWLSAPLPFLGSGVMLFFVISGFCIGLPYGGPAGREFAGREYWIRRLMRIYPPYLVTLLVCFLVERSIAEVGSPIATYAATAIMVQNYTTGQVAANPSFWSLPVEIELYLLFPLVLLILRRWGAAAVWWVTGFISLLALAVYFSGARWAELNAAKFWIIWSAGALLADWFKSDGFRKPTWLWLGLGAFALGVTIIADIRGVPPAITHFGYGFFYFVLVWWGLDQEDLWRRLPSLVLRPLLWIGTISYSLYLIHFPFFRLCGYLWREQFGGKPVNLLIPFAFALLSLVPAWLLYRWVEEPSHKLAKRWARSGKAETGKLKAEVSDIS